MERWARAKYTPNLPLYQTKNADGTVTYKRVTASPEHVALSREAAREGMVLLKNQGGLLPLRQGARIALFGKGTFDYVKGGGGSGDVTTLFIHNLYDGLKRLQDQDSLSIFDGTVQFYQNYVKEQYEQGKIPGMIREPKLSDELVREAKSASDIAIISISRFSGEAWDRKSEFGEAVPHKYDARDLIEQADEIFERSDFYLSEAEQAMVDQVKEAFDHVVVVLNVGGMVDTCWFKDDDLIQSALLSWQGGMDGGLAAAELLMGHESPSGKLPDTFAQKLEDYPSTEGFHESDVHVDYTEDVYVGYRYFETMPGLREKVNYPFGFGLSYTSFSLTNVTGRVATQAEKNALLDQVTDGAVLGPDPSYVPALSKTGAAADPDNGTGDILLFSVCVTNTGDAAGKEVVQLYYGAPQGLLGKPARQLIAYHKTKLLLPGEREWVTLRVNADDMASFDDLGRIQKSAYVLEQGEYAFYLGTDVSSAPQMDFVYTLENDVVTQRLTSKLTPRELSYRLRSDGTCENLPLLDPLNPDESDLPPKEFMDCEAPAVRPEPGRFAYWMHIHDKPQFIEVAEGKLSMEDFVAALSEEDLAWILGGQPNTGVGITFGFGNLSEFGVPNIMTSDGPAGVRIDPNVGVQTTAFPCATLLASTWNPKLVYEVGRAGAEEAKENNIGVWLTPAINIHRSPLCGRNFEYYSEDPYLTGKQAGAMVQGIQSVHVAVSLKHFALNNKESYRKHSDSRASERAIREIYLRAFEMIVKQAHPWTIMTSYNIINGRRASESKGLLEGILRGEWGFDGMVTTDWWGFGEQYKEIIAGNDIKMGCGYPERLLTALEQGLISRSAMEKAAINLLNLILKID